ncbi:MAG TPA: TolC family protein [Ohtaekwangia sp.]
MKVRFFSLILLLSLSGYSLFSQEVISVEQAIALAIEKNYDVQIAQTTAQSASTDNSYAWAAFIPQINGLASYRRTSNNQAVEYNGVRDTLNSQGRAKFDNMDASAQLTWVLFDGLTMFATRERIAVIAAQGELLVKEQMTNTIASVIAGYYDIVRQKQQLNAIQEQMAVSEERVKLAQRKLDVGTGAKPELLQAKVDYNAFRAQQLRQDALILQLKEQLNALVDMQLPPGFEVTDTIAINLGLKIDDIASGIENSNFSLLRAKRQMEIAHISLRERKGNLWPTLSFNAAYVYSETNNIVLIDPLRPAFNRTDGYNYGLSLNIPILRALNTRRLIEQEKININRQQIFYNQQRTFVNVGLRNAYINYENARQILLVEEENILLARENVSIALEGFRRGITTFIELRTAQQSLADAYNRLISARYLAKVAETEMLRLSGKLLR